MPDNCKTCLTLRCPRTPVARWLHNTTVAFNNSNYQVLGNGALRACHQPLTERDGVYQCDAAQSSWTWRFTVSGNVIRRRSRLRQINAPGLVETCAKQPYELVHVMPFSHFTSFQRPNFNFVMKSSHDQPTTFFNNDVSSKISLDFENRAMLFETSVI